MVPMAETKRDIGAHLQACIINLAAATERKSVIKSVRLLIILNKKPQGNIRRKVTTA